MDTNIKAGDLVMVVRARLCCPEKTQFGALGRVAYIHDQPIFCAYCTTPFPKGTVFAKIAGQSGNGTELIRLKRIDPPAIPETTENREELTA